MGSILSSKAKDDGKVIFEVIVDYDEAKQLQGHMENVHIFSENTERIDANLSERGKDSATKYFLIPKELRRNLQFGNKVTCQRIDTKTKTIFVYSIDKF